MRSEVSASSHRRRIGKLANELPEGGKTVFLDNLAQREKTETAKIVDRTIRKTDAEHQVDIS
jgi:hypothetical protein